MTMRRIAILAYPGCMGMGVSGVCDTLLLANRVAERLGAAKAPFDVRVVSIGAKSVLTAGGFWLLPEAVPRVFDLLVVPGFDLSSSDAMRQAMSLSAEMDLIRRRVKRGKPIASVCVGTFMLAAAGVLNGRRATTSWLFARELSRRFPEVCVQADALLVEDDGVITTGAYSAVVDLALHVIRQDMGADIADATARIALLDAARTHQSPYVDARMIDHESITFSTSVERWLAERIANKYELQTLASAFHVSTRTLLRRFKAETGVSPLVSLQRARIEKAKQRLIATRMGLRQIAHSVGYSDVAGFAELFRRTTGMRPSEYRARFTSRSSIP